MKFRFTDTAYDALAFITRYALPAFATLYFAIAQIWHLPYVGEICGTIAAIETFLASILGISTAQWTADQAVEKLESEQEKPEEHTEAQYYPLSYLEEVYDGGKK